MSLNATTSPRTPEQVAIQRLKKLLKQFHAEILTLKEQITGCR